MQFGVMDDEKQRQLEKDVMSRYSNVEIRQVGPIYGQELQVQALQALIISFIGMAIVVFLLFRSLVPSFAVILSAFSDIIIAACFHEGCRGRTFPGNTCRSAYAYRLFCR